MVTAITERLVVGSTTAAEGGFIHLFGTAIKQFDLGWAFDHQWSIGGDRDVGSTVTFGSASFSFIVAVVTQSTAGAAVNVLHDLFAASSCRINPGALVGVEDGS